MEIEKKGRRIRIVQTSIGSKLIQFLGLVEIKSAVILYWLWYLLRLNAINAKRSPFQKLNDHSGN
jgi:hypothetical protein